MWVSGSKKHCRLKIQVSPKVYGENWTKGFRGRGIEWHDQFFEIWN
jgi:hypothetical protein